MDEATDTSAERTVRSVEIHAALARTDSGFGKSVAEIFETGAQTCFMCAAIALIVGYGLEELAQLIRSSK